jgi:hypothetical protein
MDSQEEAQGQAQLAHQRQLLYEARRRLRVLEVQRVQEGYQARPQIVTEIETLEAEIKRYESNITELQKILRIQSVSVEDHQRDEDTTPNPALSRRWLWVSSGMIIVFLLGFGLWRANNLGSSEKLSNFKLLGQDLSIDDFKPAPNDGGVTATIKDGGISLSTKTRTGDILWLNKDLPQDTTIFINFFTSDSNKCNLIAGFGNRTNWFPVYYILVAPGYSEIRNFPQVESGTPHDSVSLSKQNVDAGLKYGQQENTIQIHKFQKDLYFQVNGIEVKPNDGADTSPITQLNYLFFRIPGTGDGTDSSCKVQINSITIEQ